MRSTPRTHSFVSDVSPGRDRATENDPVSDPAPRGSLGAVRVATLVAFVSALAFVLAIVSGRDREVPRLPPHERRALYGRIHETLVSTCARSSEPEVVEYCRREAAFIERLPECDSDCHALASRYSPLPSR